MRTMGRRSAAAMLLSAGITRGAVAADQTLIDAAKKEGSVTWYTGYIVNELVVPLTRAFRAKYGIKVEYTRSNSAEIILRLNNERSAGRISADLVDGAYYGPLLKSGAIVPFVPDSAKAFPATAVAQDGTWVAPNSNYLTTSYNTGEVKAGDVPKSFADLLDPKWQGRMGWTTSLNATGAPGFIGAVLGSMGKEAGMTYLRRLSQQRVVNVPAAQRVVLDQTIAGERPLALMTFNHQVATSMAKGAPVNWSRFDPVIATQTYMSAVKGGPHPNAAKLFLDFVMSQEGQQQFAAAGLIPNHPHVAPRTPELRPDVGGFKTFLITADMIESGSPEWIAVYKELFGG